MNYRIVLQRREEGISVSVPALPGCWSEGDTEEEALAMAKEAIELVLESRAERGEAQLRELTVSIAA